MFFAFPPKTNRNLDKKKKKKKVLNDDSTPDDFIRK